MITELTLALNFTINWNDSTLTVVCTHFPLLNLGHILNWLRYFYPLTTKFCVELHFLCTSYKIVARLDNQQHDYSIDNSNNNISLLNINFFDDIDLSAFKKLNWKETCKVCNFEWLKNNNFQEIDELIFRRLESSFCGGAPEYHLL